MFSEITSFFKQVLSVGQFRSTALRHKDLTALLTAFCPPSNDPVALIWPIASYCLSKPGILVLDDTTNPKYGLKRFTRKAKVLTHGGFCYGYKVLLFLWRTEDGDYPIAIALWHKETLSLNDLALEGFSLIRNGTGLKPYAVVADAAFATDKLLKRLEDYGWPCTMRCKKNRKLDGEGIRQLIPRGYGETAGRLKNGAKVKVFRRKGYFLLCNRMLWSYKKALSTYKTRWRIEELFRVLKSCLNLKGCQQHSMRAQQLYITMVLLLFH